MSDFKAKMDQIVCRLGLRPRFHWGSLQCSPRPLSWILVALLLKEGKEGEKGEGRVGKGNGEDPLLSRCTPNRYIIDKSLVDGERGVIYVAFVIKGSTICSFGFLHPTFQYAYTSET